MGWWQAAEPRCLNVMSTTEMRLGPYCYFAVDEVDWLLAFLGRASTILSPPQQWGREGVDTLVLYCALDSASYPSTATKSRGTLRTMDYRIPGKGVLNSTRNAALGQGMSCVRQPGAVQGEGSPHAT
eukprot:scaffold66739_cov32-Tisochrysis_lutea.AAC.2